MRFINLDKEQKNNSEERILNLIIVDESGSMESIYEEAFNGMNTTIENIKSRAKEIKDVNQYISLITFDTSFYKQHLRHCPAEKAMPLDRNQYQPSGGTPLYDAMGHAITSLERHVTEKDAVLVTIITDGEENSSSHFNSDDIKNLITRLTEKGWIFTFIGANQDVVLEAGRLGISHCMAFSADSEGTKAMWEKENMAREHYLSRVKSGKEAGRSMRAIMSDEIQNSINFFDR